MKQTIKWDKENSANLSNFRKGQTPKSEGKINCMIIITV